MIHLSPLSTILVLGAIPLALAAAPLVVVAVIVGLAVAVEVFLAGVGFAQAEDETRIGDEP